MIIHRKRKLLTLPDRSVQSRRYRLINRIRSSERNFFVKQPNVVLSSNFDWLSRQYIAVICSRRQHKRINLDIPLAENQIPHQRRAAQTYRGVPSVNTDCANTGCRNDRIVDKPVPAIYNHEIKRLFINIE